MSGISEQLLEPSAPAKQINVEHQFIPGGDSQLLVNAPVVLSYRTHADKRQIRDVCDLMSIDVVAEDIPLCLSQPILSLYKLVEELCDVGRKLPLLLLPVHPPPRFRRTAPVPAVPPAETASNYR